MITGLIWLWASFVLLFKSYNWSKLFEEKEFFVTIIIGIFIAITKTLLIFKKLNIKNIKIISNFKEEFVSIFKFHLPKDQILIVLMIAGGSFLRKSEFVPKLYLFPVYLGIGLAMLYSAFLYLKFYISNFRS